MKVRTFLLCLVLTPGLVQAQGKLVFSGIQGSVNSDISFAVLKRAYKKLGYDVEFIPLPGERALQRSNSGQVDGELFRIGNLQKRYPNLLQVPTSINVLEGIAFSRDKTLALNGWKSLSPYRIGIQGGIKFAERGTQKMKPVVVDTNAQLFKMLNAGRIDIAVAARVNGLVTMNKLGLQNVHVLQPALQEYPLYHYLHSKHAPLVPRLDAVLSEMHASGEIARFRQDSLADLVKKKTK